MLAEKNAYIAEAAATIYELNQDEKIRLQCETREDYYRQQASIQYEMDRRNAMIAEQDAKIEERNAKIEEQDAKIEELTSANQTLLAEKESWAVERAQLLAQIKATKN